jgi:hypothetical protein
MIAPEENSFTASFSECHSFPCCDPSWAAVLIVRGCFNVGFDGVVENVGRLFARDVVVVD